jgi:V/A-type H+-transporting ATPase subunit K
MILMFIMNAKTAVAGAGIPLLVLGIFAGIGIGLSAVFQGRAAAAACDAQAETGQGLTNYIIALGIVETVSIFVMVFTLIALGKVA